MLPEGWDTMGWDKLREYLDPDEVEELEDSPDFDPEHYC